MTSSSLTPSKCHSFGFLLLFLFITALLPSSYKTLIERKKKTHLHFYIHMIFSSPNPTSIISTNPNSKAYSFGAIRVFDHELREGPEQSSKLIGRLQGTAAQASLIGSVANLVQANHVFIAGKYKGSTLAIFERYELPESIGDTGQEYNVTVANIIGGTGRFMLARGYSLVRIHSVLNSSEGQIIVLEDDSYFKHYKIKPQ